MNRLRRVPSLAVLTLLAALVEGGVRSLGLRRVCALLGIRLETHSGATDRIASLPGDPGARVEQWSRRVDSVVNRGPRPGRCLRRALLLGFLLRDLGPVLRIGVVRSPSTLEAHAWLEIDGCPVAEPAGRDPEQAFTPLRGGVPT